MPSVNSGEKDVYSINELSAINRLLSEFNDFLVDAEDDEFVITTAVINVTDKTGHTWGALTKWTKDEDVKFEPGFKADLA